MNSSGFKDVDFGLTTREMAQMIKEAGYSYLKCQRVILMLRSGMLQVQDLFLEQQAEL